LPSRLRPSTRKHWNQKSGEPFPNLRAPALHFGKPRVVMANRQENLGNLLRQVSKASMGEIDSLISELQTLRRKLQTDGDRIERDIAKYAELNQQVMQLTEIISDSVKKLPRASVISR
jgi:peptidoglycan hydrolase CwlO-like protein